MKSTKVKTGEAERVSSVRASKYDELVDEIMSTEVGSSVVVPVEKGKDPAVLRNLLQTAIKGRIAKVYEDAPDCSSLRFFVAEHKGKPVIEITWEE